MYLYIHTRYAIHITYWTQYASYPPKGAARREAEGCVAAPRRRRRRCRSSFWPVHTGVPPAMPPPCQAETVKQMSVFQSEVSAKPQHLVDPFYPQQKYFFKTEPVFISLNIKTGNSFSKFSPDLKMLLLPQNWCNAV